jgi:hypothetical protein
MIKACKRRQEPRPPRRGERSSALGWKVPTQTFPPKWNRPSHCQCGCECAATHSPRSVRAGDGARAQQCCHHRKIRWRHRW